MSAPPPNDRLPTGRIVAIGAFALVIFGLAILWSASVQRGINHTLKGDTAAKPEFAGRQEIGIVFQPTFDDHDWARGTNGTSENRSIASQKHIAAAQRLEMTDFSDLQHHFAVIPIERAMELLVAKQKPSAIRNGGAP